MASFYKTAVVLQFCGVQGVYNGTIKDRKFVRDIRTGLVR
jgi:uncharacterized membrane protein